MSPMVNKTLKLTLICAIAALLLGIVNSITEPVIKERKAQMLKEALSSLVEEGSIGEAEIQADSLVNTVYPVKSDGSVISCILSIQGSGYGGDMQVLGAYSLDGTLLNAQLMENNETPGLGKKAESHEYMEKFIDYGGLEPIPVRKDMLPPGMDDITGATITFNGVSQALAAGSEYVKSREWN